MMIKPFYKVTILAAAMALAGCGGSNGYFDVSSNPSSTNGATGSTGGSTATAAVNVSAVTLLNDQGNATRIVSSSGATASVTVTDATGAPISGALVTFSGTGLKFGTSNGAVITDAKGVATISVAPQNNDDTGSYTLDATASYNGQTAKAVGYNYSLQAANIALSDITAGTTNLPSGGTTILSLKTLDADSNSQKNNVPVSFSANCGTFTNVSVISSSQGDVATTYKAIDANGNLCEGKQTITATTSKGSIKKIELNVAAIQASSIVYTSNSVQLGIKSSGSSTSGKIEFTVYANGVPAANQDVVISKLYAPSDFSFVRIGNTANQTVKSDSTGKVSVILYPGDLPGPVEIRATLANDPTVYALSKDVSVATGRATQNGLSLSISKNALRADTDGDTATITARLVDRLGNPVPDGTVISFIAEGGMITPNCSTTNGICSVTLSTQNPRPIDNRVTVLAYLEGDKSYTDVNGDNQYTAGVDTITSNIGDFFRDDNENTQFEAGEFKYIRGASGSTCAPSTFYQPNIGSTCDNSLSTVIRQQLVVAFSHDTPTYVAVSGIDAGMNQTSASNGGFSFKVFGNAMQTVPLPSGSSVSVTTKDNTKDNQINCSAEIVRGSMLVPALMNLMTPSTFQSNEAIYVLYRVKLTECAPGDEVRLTINDMTQVITVR